MEPTPVAHAPSSFSRLRWLWNQHWAGGLVPRGPMVQKHHFTVDGDGAVIYQAEQKLGP